MLSVLLISRNGEGFSIASKLAEEGHLVKFYNNEEWTDGVGKGFRNPKKVDNYTEPAKSSDIVLHVNSRTGKGAIRVPEAGGLVIGSGRFQELLKDPEYVNMISKLINLPTTTAEEEMEFWVCGWFMKTDWAPQSYIAFEYKRFMEGDKGVLTSGQGVVVKFISNEELAFQKTLGTLTALLQKTHYTGPLYIKVGVSENRLMLRYIDVEPRNGFIQAASEGYKSLSCLLYSSFSDNYKGPVNLNSFGMSLTLSLPPYPYVSEFKNFRLKQVIQEVKGASKHLWYEDVCKTEDGVVFAGTTGKICYVTSWGDTASEARRRTYRTVNNVKLFDDMQYRQDVGINVDRQVQRLIELGYITNKESKDASTTREVTRSNSVEYKGTYPLIQEDRKDRELETEGLGES